MCGVYGLWEGLVLSFLVVGSVYAQSDNTVPNTTDVVSPAWQDLAPEFVEQI